MLTLPLAAVVAALLPASGGAPAAGFDFGDAPDGASAGYVGRASVRGAFPSKAVSGGPRHSSSGPRIGTRWTGESASRQVDRDADDGAQLEARSCAVSTIRFVLDASRVPAGTPVYVNAWFDWNRDGDWGDGGSARCGPEWGIQNRRIDPAFLDTKRIAAVTLRFRAGKLPPQLWWRLEVHTGDPAPHAGGGGQTTASAGETEDQLHDRLPPERAPQVDLRCDWFATVRAHGLNGGSGFLLVGSPTPVVLRVAHSLFGDTRGLRVKRFDHPRRWWVDVVSIHKHRRRPVVQTVFVRLEVEVLVRGQKRRLTRNCANYFVHAKPYGPDGVPPVITTPAILVGVDPIRPDPVQARCAAEFTPRGFTPGSVGASGGRVLVRCDGVDIKSFSVSAGSANQRITAVQDFFYPFPTTCLPVAVNGVDRRAFQCIVGAANKGREVGAVYETDQPFASTTLHVLAGGVGQGTGTTIVLRQTFFFPREGPTCSQSVPDAAACATFVYP